MTDNREFPRDLPRRVGQAGYTLLEVLVSLAIMIVVLVGVLALLEFNSRVAKAQVNVAEMQQSLRIVQSEVARDVRMAGRGGLPRWRQPTAGGYAGMFLPDGVALAVVNDVADGVTLGGSAQAAVMPGTDILTIRGVLRNVLYQVNWETTDGDVGGARTAGNGAVVVRETTPAGIRQNLDPLVEALAACGGGPCPEALILIGPGNSAMHAVVELTGGVSQAGQVSLNFTLAEGTHSANYARLSPGGEFPVGLRSVAMVGILEEYRYYVRDVAPVPTLARARLYPTPERIPGPDSAYAGQAANLVVDLADNILDLQIALGIDRGNDEIVQDTGDAADDWLFNAPGDDPPTPADWNGQTRPLYYVRITTLARTDRIDPKYVSPPIQALEDNVYNEPAVPADADARLQRSFRRRVLQTVVDLRNLS
jgi:Tfp pilus assembly protein PilV